MPRRPTPDNGAADETGGPRLGVVFGAHDAARLRAARGVDAVAGDQARESSRADLDFGQFGHVPMIALFSRLVATYSPGVWSGAPEGTPT